jgi:hypothetical protein
MRPRVTTTLLCIGLVFLAGCAAAGPLAADGATVDGPSFEEVAADRGFEYTATLAVDFGGPMGVYVTDYNNDHREDVLAIGGERPVLFENTGGEFERTDAVPSVDESMKSALFFDHDNDGWEDLLLLPENGSAVFLENENGSFRERDVGFDDDLRMARGSVADYDADGCLDVFVAQSGDWRENVPKAALPPYSPEDALLDDGGEPNYLYAGDCETFERVGGTGIEGERWSLVTSFVDVTGDGQPDVHVGNDFNVDVLYINQGDGTFERVEIPGTARHAMASEVADVTGDGRLDIFVTNVHFSEEIQIQGKMSSMDNRGNNLLVNQGDGTFTTEEDAYGVRDGGWGWAAAIVDLDNDGQDDLVHTTKDYLTKPDEDGTIRKIETRPSLWRRTGEEFSRVNSSAAGFEHSSGRGMAHLDYNGDGQRDLVVATAVGDYKLYKNQGTGRNWLQIDLERMDAPVLGSDVYVETNDGTQYQVVTERSDFLSQDSRTVHVGLDDAESVTVRVEWPDGTERTVDSVEANQRVVIPQEGPVRPVTAES